ncbi:MAG TPA: tetratricopeptide repeat protein [Candidatus Babeliales bacterium]|nr:tetratricopeptide repeat protein [Candidatus Babeliales bacterium]
MFRDKSRFACALQALDRRDFAAAEAAFCELLACDRLVSKERAFLLNKRGVARIGLEQRDLARADFQSALEAVAQYAPALTNLGNLLLEDGDLEAAVAHYQKAIAADCDYALAYLNLGVAHKRAGRLAESVKALRRAQRLERRTNGARLW